MIVYYLIGYPGSGKTTLMNTMLNPYFRECLYKPVKHTVYPELSAMELGWRNLQHALFMGTDTLPFDAQPKVIEWLQHEPYAIVFGEGDRLGNRKFRDCLLLQGIDFRLIYLEISAELALYRRRQRGTYQDATWVKGRMTKVNNLAADADYRLDGNQSPKELAEQLWKYVQQS